MLEITYFCPGMTDSRLIYVISKKTQEGVKI